MEKTIFLFRRKASRSPADFKQHYVRAHKFALIRMAWAADLASLGAAAADALVVEEYRFLPAPAWE